MVVPGNSDTPLVLIHGQCMCGLDYEKVIEKLRKKYTLYLIDCFGHGESEKARELYRCNVIGDAIADLIRNEIGKSCIISGHSSGGILAAYVAGVIPELVKGVLLEDPPFFNARPGEFENTFVYHDGFRVTHDFLNQTEEKEYLVYNIEHGYIYNYLGDRYFGKDWVHKLAEEVKEKLKDAPGEIPKIKGMSENAFRGFIYMDKFDKLFSESFYTGEWFEGVDQESILKAVQCPVVYLKAKTKSLCVWIWTAIIAVTKIICIVIASKKVHRLEIEHSLGNKLTGLLLFLLPLSACVADGKYGAILVCIAATVTVIIEVFNAVQDLNLCAGNPESDYTQEVRRI